MASRKVLITGVNGFLGKALWEYLTGKQSSFETFGIDRYKTLSSCQVFSCDLNNTKEILKVISNIRPDYIFHLSGGKVNIDKDLLRNNVLATQSLLETVTAITDYSPRIVIPGSAAEYGKTLPRMIFMKETMPTRPISFYGFAKSMQTNLGLMYARTGLDVMVTRIFNVCGYGTPPTLALGRFSRQIAFIEKNKRRPVIRTRNLGTKRDFLDVKDVCSALLKVARRGRSGEIYNICSGNSYLMRDLLENLIVYSNVDNILIKEDREKTVGTNTSVGSNEKIKKETGWKPKVSIGRSLKNTLSYYQEFVSKE